MSTTQVLLHDKHSLRGDSEKLELSVIMPCLNEAETLGACIDAALESFAKSGLVGEVIVADNGSSDGSQQIAAERGARVVSVSAKGYGNALRGGIEAAHGKYIVFADSDCSYDFGEAPRFVEKLKQGYDLVMGNRFQGGIHPNAMPSLHRYLGNPVLSGLGRLFYRTPVGDFHCGLRAFSKEAFERMELCTTGMEFASEMVIKSALKGLRTTEIPIELHPDGRSRPPHLRSWRDGWRHLRFMLLLCPRWLFLVPGMLLLVLGIVGGLVLANGPLFIGPAGFDIHTLLVAGLAVILGLQLVICAAHVKQLAVILRIHPPNRSVNWLGQYLTIEIGSIVGGVVMLFGAALLGWTTYLWQHEGFGPLDPSVTMRRVIPAVVLITCGMEILFGSFFLGFLGFVAEQLASNDKRSAGMR